MSIIIIERGLKPVLIPKTTESDLLQALIKRDEQFLLDEKERQKPTMNIEEWEKLRQAALRTSETLSTIEQDTNSMHRKTQSPEKKYRG